jgi:hypothetical protein
MAHITKRKRTSVPSDQISKHATSAKDYAHKGIRALGFIGKKLTKMVKSK